MITLAGTLKVFVVDDEYLIGASFAEGRVAVVSSARKMLLTQLELPAGCRYAFGISSDGRHLAAGYQYVQLSSLQVWDLSSGALVAERPKSYPFALDFEPRARYIIYDAIYGTPGTYFYEVSSHKVEKLRGACGPPNAAFTRDGQTMLMPRKRGAGGFRVTFQPFGIAEISLPTKKPAWLLRASPCTDTFLILDSGATVSNVDVSSGELVWKRKVPEAGWLSYSGDGRFVAVTEHRSNGGVKRLVVLEGRSGEIIRIIELAERASDPLAGPKVLCLSGRFVNLETGEVEPGVSDLDWWNSLLCEQRGEDEA